MFWSSSQINKQLKLNPSVSITSFSHFRFLFCHFGRFLDYSQQTLTHFADFKNGQFVGLSEKGSSLFGRILSHFRGFFFVTLNNFGSFVTSFQSFVTSLLIFRPILSHSRVFGDFEQFFCCFEKLSSNFRRILSHFRDFFVSLNNFWVVLDKF